MNKGQWDVYTEPSEIKAVSSINFNTEVKMFLNFSQFLDCYILNTIKCFHFVKYVRTSLVLAVYSDFI